MRLILANTISRAYIFADKQADVFKREALYKMRTSRLT